MRLKSTIILAIISLAFTAKLYAQALIDSTIKYPVEYREGYWQPKESNDTTYRLGGYLSHRDVKNLVFQLTPRTEAKFRRELRLNTWKYGLIDTTGRVIIEPEWDRIGGFDSEMLLVTKDATLNEWSGAVMPWNDGKSGYIDLQGNVIIPIEYSWIGYFFETGVVEFTKSGRFSPDKALSKREYKRSQRRYLKSLEKPTKPRVLGGIKSYQFRPFSNAKYGLINRKGEIVIPETYDDIHAFRTFAGDDAFLVLNKDKFGAIDQTGKILVPLIYENFLAVKYLVEEHYQKLKSDREKEGDSIVRPRE